MDEDEDLDRMHDAVGHMHHNPPDGGRNFAWGGGRSALPGDQMTSITLTTSL